MDEPASLHGHYVALFHVHFPRLWRYLDRLTGDPALASDVAEQTFIRLFRRRSLPEAPEAWLIRLAMNLFRNERSGRRPLTRQAMVTEEAPQRVREAIDRMPERERRLLLLRAEGYSYRDMAEALDLNEGSIGTLLARARAAFRECYEDPGAS